MRRISRSLLMLLPLLLLACRGEPTEETPDAQETTDSQVERGPADSLSPADLYEYPVNFLSGTEGLGENLIGSWNSLGTDENIEFFEDGTVVIDNSTSDRNLAGDYRILDKSRIRIDLGMMYGSTVWSVAIKGDYIAVSGAEDSREFYSRQKSTP